MARVLLKGGRVAYTLADSLPAHEVKCTCGGENPNCMYCDGLGIVRGRCTSPVPHRTDAQTIRRAIQESKSKTTAAITLERFEKSFLANLERLMPAHHCMVRFVDKYPCNRLPAGAIAFRTKYLFEQSDGRVVQLTWHNPQHCDLVVHRHTPLGLQMVESQLSFDLAGNIVARSDSAPVIIQKPTLLMRASPQRDGIKSAGKSKDRYAGKITLRDSHGSTRRKPSSVKPNTDLREPADVRPAIDERALDATYGTHVFREYGSGQFGSMPSHDEFDE